MLLALGAAPAAAYQIQALLGPTGAGQSISTTAEAVNAASAQESAQGSYYIRSSATDGSSGLLQLTGTRFSRSPALESSTLQGRVAAATVSTLLRLTDYAGPPDEEVVLVVRMRLGGLHAFHGRSVAEGIIGPPPGPTAASARLVARISVGLGSGSRSHAWINVTHNGRGTISTESSVSTYPGEVQGGANGMEIRLRVTRQDIDWVGGYWRAWASLVGEANASGENYYMEMNGSGSVWVGVEGGPGWRSEPGNSPFLRKHPGGASLAVAAGAGRLQLIGYPGQVFQLQDASSLGAAWTQVGQVVIGAGGTAIWDLPSLGAAQRFFQLVPEP